MKHFFLAILCASLSSTIWANAQNECEASYGHYLTGTVVRPPFFKHGPFKKGVELSHTHLSLKADQDTQVYDVAIDNVFAFGYIKNNPSIPSSINTIALNDHLELCGLLYSKGTGIHWVHTNCGEAPAPNRPNGWIKKLEAHQQASSNLESSTDFCYLWPHRKKNYYNR